MKATSGHVAVLGAGGWGTALAQLLAGRDLEVRIWSHNPEVAQQIQGERVNRLYLEGITLHPGIRVTTEFAEALEEAAAVICALPSHAVRTILGQAKAWMPAEALWVSATKGLEVETRWTISQVIGSVLPGVRPVVLSGPSFAREVAQGHPTAVVVAAADASAAQAAQALFSAPRFRVYTNPDVLGVELAGALKNVVALASGIVEGLGYGHNTRAALITRGLAEITRLGTKMGAQPLTFSGLAGMGDLILTCTGALSRNRSVGLRLAAGQRLQAILAQMRMVAEGVNTTRAAARLAQEHGVEVPIAREVHAVLFDGKDPAAAVEELMLRKPKSEHWGVRHG